MSSSKSRANHYVPKWYQFSFLESESSQLFCLNLQPDTKELPDGRLIKMNARKRLHPSQCFYQIDLYTTFFGSLVNDDIERLLFGQIDDSGARAVRAIAGTKVDGWYEHFSNFFSYLDAQKMRTPKGLLELKSYYGDLNQNDLMAEMQATRFRNCTIWAEAVREIVSAEESSVKFIITDAPVTIYNHAIPIEAESVPSVLMKASQTIFPLNADKCLILTNLEYARDPEHCDPIENRTNPKPYRQSLAKVDEWIRTRNLSSEDVCRINLLLKKSARRYIAAAEKEWLYPEQEVEEDADKIKQLLMPPKDQLYRYSGEIYAGFDDGRTYYQDAFGRTNPEADFLKKTPPDDIAYDDPCGCGSGKRYGFCCKEVPIADRPSWKVLSIRERNLAFFSGLVDILGFNQGKDWVDFQREISDEQVIRIHELFQVLWPASTDLIALLPKSGGELRAVYSGLLDPRTTPINAMGLAPYFDELLIQHPFMNPENIKAEFSPISSPHNHKQQTLKNVMLFFSLFPLIDHGYINLVPDPTDLDIHLKREMLDLASERRRDSEIDKVEAKKLKKLHEEDIRRTLSTNSGWLASMRDDLELSEAEFDEIATYLKIRNQADPLAVLQENISHNDGQLHTVSMGPNYEMAMFLAQVVGGVIITDSETRWRELIEGARRSGDIRCERIASILGILDRVHLPLASDPQALLDLRQTNRITAYRDNLKSIFAACELDQVPIKHIGELKQRVRTFLRSPIDIGKEQPHILARLKWAIPTNGISSRAANRLLVKAGSINHRKSVHAAAFIDLGR